MHINPSTVQRMSNSKCTHFARAQKHESTRFLWIDLARTVAICSMIVFHFVRDLEFFGMIAPGTTVTGGWALFARLIAGSFLFLSGFSLVLAHRSGFRMQAWCRRFAVVSAAAGLVTLVTYFAYPDRFIYFGILHAIAMASLIGLPFVFVAGWAALVAAMTVVALDLGLLGTPFTSEWMAWTGLSTHVRASLDFIPIVPWLAPFLIGVAIAKSVSLQQGEPSAPVAASLRAITWPGRHSLAIYLLHQPVLLALVLAFA
jgi:uncharacterized membrane protein